MLAFVLGLIGKKEPRQAELRRHPAGSYNGQVKKALTKSERFKYQSV